MKHTTKIEGFDERLATYVSALQEIFNKHWADNNFIHAPVPTAITTEGNRYIKVVRGGIGHQPSIHTFVDKTNGNILKGTWQAPVKNGVRGNIFNEVCTQGVNHYGPDYLR